MNKRTLNPGVSAAARPAPTNELAVLPKSQEIVELLAKTARSLDAGDPKRALDLIDRARLNSPWLTNALGVCHLRLGNAKIAMDAFRGLVLAGGGILLRSDVPVVFKTNFAISLLMLDNLGGCLSILAELQEDEHPAVGRLKRAVQRWKQGLSWWEKMRWYLGGQIAQPVVLDFPPGDLE